MTDGVKLSLPMPPELWLNVLDQVDGPEEERRLELAASLVSPLLPHRVDRQVSLTTVRAGSRRVGALNELFSRRCNDPSHPTHPTIKELSPADRVAPLDVMVHAPLTLEGGGGRKATAHQEFSHFKQLLGAILPGSEQLIPDQPSDAGRLLAGLIDHYHELKSGSHQRTVHIYSMDALQLLKEAIDKFQDREQRLALSMGLCESVRRLAPELCSAAIGDLVEFVTFQAFDPVHQGIVPRFDGGEQGALLGMLASQRDYMERENGAHRQVLEALKGAISNLRHLPDAFLTAAAGLFTCPPDLPRTIHHDSILPSAEEPFLGHCKEVLTKNGDATLKANLVVNMLRTELHANPAIWGANAMELLNRLPPESLPIALRAVAAIDPSGVGVAFGDYETQVKRWLRHLAQSGARPQGDQAIDDRNEVAFHVLALANTPAQAVAGYLQVDKLLIEAPGDLARIIDAIPPARRRGIMNDVMSAPAVPASVRNRLATACHLASLDHLKQAEGVSATMEACRSIDYLLLGDRHRLGLVYQALTEEPLLKIAANLKAAIQLPALAGDEAGVLTACLHLDAALMGDQRQLVNVFFGYPKRRLEEIMALVRTASANESQREALDRLMGACMIAIKALDDTADMEA